MGVGIGGAHPPGAGEGADQHEQGGARQVEVRHQAVHGAETEAGADEDGGFAGEGLHAVLRHRGFQQAERGGADGDHAGGGADFGGGLFGDLAALGVHVVLVRVAAHGQEGACAHMQRDRGGG